MDDLAEWNRCGDDAAASAGTTRAGSRKFGFFVAVETTAPDVRISAHLHAPASAFVAVRYENPPGGLKTCLNTKRAACGVVLARDRRPARSSSPRVARCSRS